MGIPLENIPLYTLHFADDQVVLAGDKERFTVLLLLLLLLVFSPWAGLGRDQSSVRRLVWLWYAASWANS